MNPLVREQEIERKMYRRIRQIRLLTDDQIRSMLNTYGVLRTGKMLDKDYMRLTLSVDEQCLADIEAAVKPDGKYNIHINYTTDRIISCEPAFQRVLTRSLLLWPEIALNVQLRMDQLNECYWIIHSVEKSKVFMVLMLVAYTAEAFYQKRLDRNK